MDNETVTKNLALKNLMLSLAEKEAWAYNSALIERSLSAMDADLLSGRDELIFVGHGTSYATAMCAASWASHIAGLPSRAVTAYEFRQYTEDLMLAPERSAVLGISCSGGTESVRLALQKAREAGAVTVLLSGEGDISCASAADIRILTDSHIEDRSGTKAASVSHIFLMEAAYRLSIWLGRRSGALSGEDSAYWENCFAATVDAMKCLPALFDRMGEIASELTAKGYDSFAVLGTGPNGGTAREAALKICEFAWKFCACEELEDFQHGRFREVNDNVAVLITAPRGRNSGKILEILNICSKAGLGSLVVTDCAEGELLELAPNVVELPELPDEYLTPFLYIFPYWFLGYHIMESAGGKVGESRYVYRGGFIGRPENLPG